LPGLGSKNVALAGWHKSSLKFDLAAWRFVSTENYGELVASNCFRFLVVRKIGLRWSEVETPVAHFSRMRFVLSALGKGEKSGTDFHGLSKAG